MSRLVILSGFDDALQMFRAFGPDERIAGGVVVGEETQEEILKFLLRSLHAMRQPLLAEDAEEALDQIDPGGVRGSVMEPVWSKNQAARE